MDRSSESLNEFSAGVPNVGSSRAGAREAGDSGLAQGNSARHRITGTLNAPKLPEDIRSALGERYTSLRFISSGATSMVFYAIDTILDKPVAIKILNQASEKELINFQKEAKAAGKLDHPNLVHVLNFGVASGHRAYMVLDFIDGESLERILSEKHVLPIEMALDLLLQICDGMIYAHHKQISHRDLKTSNIIIKNYGSEEPQAIIIDFGLARDLEHQTETMSGATTSTLQGTPIFISPEQAAGKYGDTRSDIYSLGCIIYKMVTGKPPFESGDLFNLLRRHIDDDPPSLRELAPDLKLPTELEDCTLRMLEKEPEHRQQTMEEVRDDLVAVKRALSSQKELEAPVPESGPDIKKRRLTIIVVVLIVMLPVTWMLAYILEPAQKLPTINSSNISIAPENTAGDYKTFQKIFRATPREYFLDEHDWPHIAPKDVNNFTDEQLKCFRTVDLNPPKLNLSATKINGDGLKYLIGKNITQLDLSRTQLQDSAFEYIGKLSTVERMSLSFSDVTDAQLKRVLKLPRLKELRLNSCKNLSNAAIEGMSGLPALEELDLQRNPALTDRGIATIANCKRMKRLILSGTDPTDDGVDKIIDLEHLHDLKLASCHRITSKTLLSIIERRPHLDNLSLSETAVAPEDLVHIKKLKDLKYLDLTGLKVNAKGLESIGTLRKLHSLYLAHLDCTDADLKYLYGLKGIDTLSLFNCPRVTAAGLAGLKQATGCENILSHKPESKILRPEFYETLDMFIDSDNDKEEPNKESSLPSAP